MSTCVIARRRYLYWQKWDWLADHAYDKSHATANTRICIWMQVCERLISTVTHTSGKVFSCIWIRMVCCLCPVNLWGIYGVNRMRTTKYSIIHNIIFLNITYSPNGWEGQGLEIIRGELSTKHYYAVCHQICQVYPGDNGSKPRSLLAYNNHTWIWDDGLRDGKLRIEPPYW